MEAKKGGRKSVAASCSMQQQVCLQLSVGRVARFLKKGRYDEHLSSDVPIYLAAILEDNKKCCIVPRHRLLAVRNEEELERMLRGVTISSPGVLPNINQLLLPNKSGKAKAAATTMA